MSKLSPTYTLVLIADDQREVILESEPDINRVRTVANSRSISKRLRKGLNRRLEILKDGKVMRGGRFALDTACYERWLEDNQPEDA